jgi:hypothetical protein
MAEREKNERWHGQEIRCQNIDRNKYGRTMGGYRTFAAVAR